MAHLVMGSLSLPLVECIEGFYRSLLRPGTRLSIFSDARLVTHVTREARERGTAFVREHLFAFPAIHVLIASPHAALAYGAFRQDVGEEHVFIYSDRESLLRSFAQAMNEAANGRGPETPP
jgi:hypothetical protein